MDTECACGSGTVLDGGESSIDDGGEGYESNGKTTPRFGIEIDVGAEGGVTLMCKFGYVWVCDCGIGNGNG